MHTKENSPPAGIFKHLAWCCLPQVPILLLAVATGLRGYWFALPIVFLMVVIPALDLITGWQDNGHFEKNNFNAFDTAILHWNTRIYAVFYMAAVTYFALNIRHFTLIEIGLLVYCCSLLGGIGFACAHELVHCKEGIDQFLQRILTSFLFYPHYKLIHIRSHHVHAGTDEDENTAWYDESIYAYMYRTIPGSAARSWHLETKRVFTSNRSPANNLIRNKMITYAVGQVLLFAALYLLAGPWGLAFYVAQIIGSHVVLESVNYIQHYGLMRKQHNGEYEKTGPEHAWDTYHFFSSYVSFRVGHHSYHHIAVKPYYLLDPAPEAPKLPAGYFWSIPIVLLPPWWRRVINPRLKPAV